MIEKDTVFIELPIGDWSKDYGGVCDRYIFKSNMNVESIREIHYLSERYNLIIKDFYKNKELEHIFNRINTPYKINDLYEYIQDEKRYVPINTKSIALLWSYILMKTSEILLKENKDNYPFSIINKEVLKMELLNIDSIVFYGRDSLGRHIFNPGGEYIVENIY